MTRMLSRLLAAVGLILLAAPALGQNYNVPAHAIPLGRGTNVSAFNSIAPAANTKFLVGGGTSADPVMQTMSGDCSLVAGVVTCTKTNNVGFATSATTDTTNAANIGSGTLPNARLDSEVQCIAGLTSAADKVPYYTGSGTCALGDFGSALRTFNTTSSSANLRSLLTDEVGTGADYFVGGALGTPASATLTNATGLPVSGITSSTSTPLGVGSLELGNASDTTLARSSAGNVTIEGNAIYRAGGTDVPLTDGGTGSSTAPGARVNLNIDQATTHGDSAYTILSTDRVVLTTTTFTAARTWTLPPANSVNAGQRLRVSDAAGAINGSNTLTLQRAGSDTLNGSTSAALTTQYADVDLVSDGASKWTFAAAGGGGGSGTVTSVAISAGTGISTSGTCSITTSGTCTIALADQQRQNIMLGCAYNSKAMAAALRLIETYCDGFKASDGIASGSSSNYVVDTTAGQVGPTFAQATAVYAGVQASSSTSNPLTYTTQPIGTASADRYVLVVVTYRVGIPTSVTVAGQSTSLIGHSPGTSGSQGVSMFLTDAPVTTGTTATVVVSQDTAPNASAIQTYAITNLGSVTPSDMRVWGSGAQNVSVPATGTLIVGVEVGSGSSVPSISATGLTSDNSANSINLGRAVGHGNYSSATSVSVTTANGGSGGAFTIAASFAGGPANNMTLVTTMQTADATVTGGRVLLEYDPLSSTTLNTDLTAELTCDGGSHWTSGTLASAGKGQAGRTVAETADITCGTSGTSFGARIKTLNNKNVRLYKSAVAVH